MLRIRKAAERGHIQHGWLNTAHTFSFGEYHDPHHNHFRNLRVMNEDHVAPGQGFGMHPHRDMEIVTYILSGSLAHKDSMGHGELLRPGELQRMTAGTGIMHSEVNPSRTEAVHLYQIWLFPRERGLSPSYEQRAFPEAEKQGRLRVVAAPDGREGALQIQQDASLYLSLLDPQQQVTHELAPGRHAWVQVLRGSVAVNGTELATGDGVAISDEQHLTIEGRDPAEVMLFDLN